MPADEPKKNDPKNDAKNEPPKKAAPAPAPAAAPASAVDGLAEQLVRDLAHAMLVAPRAAGGYGQAPPPSPAECIARARRLVADLVPHLVPQDVDGLDVCFAMMVAGISPQLSLTIAREWLALQAQLVAPE